MDRRRCVLLWLSVMTVGCEASEPRESDEAATTVGSGQDGGEALGAGSDGSATGAPSMGGGQTDGSNTPGVATGLTDGGTASPGGGGMTSVRNDAGGASSGLDAAAALPDWAGLVTLDASITFAPDGAVISRDGGGFPHYDPDAAGPILNPEAQAACLMLTNNVCNRSADCQGSMLQVSAARRDQLVKSCLDTLLLNHNCNRAVRTTASFSACAESVKTRDCAMVFASNFATACVDQITFQP